MKQGTIFQVCRLGISWPPNSSRMILEKKQEDTVVYITGCPDGHLKVTIESPADNLHIYYETQPIIIHGSGMLLLTIIWQEEQIAIRINGIPLKSFQETSTALLVVTNDPLPTEKSAIEHEDAPNQCRDWILWRQQHFGTSKIALHSRRLKKEEEQVTELENEIASLKELANMVQIGKRHMLQKIAGSLRGLLYWKIGKNNNLIPSYSPLLLRIAARANVPLPVFAMSDDRDIRPTIVDQAQLSVVPNTPTLHRVYPRQQVMDLQEWLNSPISTEHFEPLSAPANIMAAKDIIEAAANTLGGSHFDEDIPVQLDTLRNIRFEGENLLNHFLIDVSGVVVELGIFVIERWRTCNKSPD